MRILYVLTIWFIKSLTIILKLTKRGRGTALPGLIIEKYFPRLIPYVLNKSPYTILITGTNGKTTTRTFLNNILQTKYRVLQNRSGSNLIRGIVSEIISQTNIFGELNYDYAIFEVEEASMPKITKHIKPEMIIVTNLFRDQLDAYGEVDRTQRFIQEAVDLTPNSIIILNNDDPRVKSIKVKDSSEVQYFGINDMLVKNFGYEGINIETHNKVEFATDLTITKQLGTNFRYKNQNFIINIPGYFNVYNAMASILSALNIGLDLHDINKALESTQPAFGRGEIMQFEGKELHLFLVKNPAGFNLNLDLLQHLENINLCLVLNDNTADGKDVSWIWDSNLELLNKYNLRSIVCSGSRSEDISLRCKYAFNEELSKSIDIIEIKDINELINTIKGSGEKSYYLLLTYTAMLELRKIITGNSLNV
jgi:UDP-N-acetylmuramyl tripeptide synthase